MYKHKSNKSVKMSMIKQNNIIMLKMDMFRLENNIISKRGKIRRKITKY